MPCKARHSLPQNSFVGAKRPLPVQTANADGLFNLNSSAITVQQYSDLLDCERDVPWAAVQEVIYSVETILRGSFLNCCNCVNINILSTYFICEIISVESLLEFCAKWPNFKHAKNVICRML